MDGGREREGGQRKMDKEHERGERGYKRDEGVRGRNCNIFSTKKPKK